MDKPSTVDPIEGLEVGVEVGQDNMGMDSVEEEITSPRKFDDLGIVFFFNKGSTETETNVVQRRQTMKV